MHLHPGTGTHLKPHSLHRSWTSPWTTSGHVGPFTGSLGMQNGIGAHPALLYLLVGRCMRGWYVQTQASLCPCVVESTLHHITSGPA
jgi:hypothetical protein